MGQPQRPVVPALLSLAIIMALGSARPASADPDHSAREACRVAVAERARATLPARQRLQFLGDGRINRFSDIETAVEGVAQFQTGGTWARFTYRCVYNIRTDRTGRIEVKPA